MGKNKRKTDWNGIVLLIVYLSFWIIGLLHKWGIY